jgi:hypothetical protein
MTAVCSNPFAMLYLDKRSHSRLYSLHALSVAGISRPNIHIHEYRVYSVPKCPRAMMAIQ